MEFPFIIILLVYAIPLFIAFGMAITNIYHVVRFGGFDARNTAFVILFIVYLLVVLGGVGAYFAPVDWSQSIVIPLPNLSFGSS